MIAKMLTLLLLFPIASARAQDSFFGASADGGLTWHGDVSLAARYRVDAGDPTATAVDTIPELGLSLLWLGPSAEVRAGLRFADQEIDGFGDLVEEASARLFGDRLDLSVGMLKVVWGKGDELHVLDPLCSTDYRDFVNRPYLERRVAEPLVKVDLRLGGALLELAYAPVFTPDSYPAEGPWVLRQMAALQEQVYAALVSQWTAIYGALALPPDQVAALARVQAAAQLPDAITTEDTRTLEHGRFGARLTGTAGRFDLGALAYAGFFPEPVYDLSTVAAGSLNLTFDRAGLFGLEAAAAFGRLNLRSELGYWLTADTAGTDPLARNNRLVYLLGIDRDLGFASLRLLVEGQGTAIMASGGIDLTADIDHDAAGEYSRHVVMARLQGAYFHERVTPQLVAALGVEKGDLLIRPEISFVLKDALELTLRGALFQGAGDTDFGQFDDNDYVEIEARMRF